MKKRYFNKWLIFLLIFAIVIPQVFLGNAVQVGAAQTGIVTATTLNVREKPSTTASKMQVNGNNVFLTKGETVNIMNEDGDFYYVSIKFSGKTVKGYVHSDFISLDKKVVESPIATPSATPKPTAKPTPKPNNPTTNSIEKEVELKAVVTATTLNVRKGPGTTYAKVVGLKKGNAVTIINEIKVDSAEWYRISYQYRGTTKTGYVLNSFVKLSYSSTVKGEITASKLNIRAVAGSKASYLKNKSGNIVSLKEDKAITMIDETTVSGVKWFKISFSLDGKKYVGFAEANQVNFRVTETKSSQVPTVTPKPTTAPKPTTTPAPITSVKPSPKPTIAPTKAPTPSPKPTIAPTKAPTPTPKVTPTPTMIPTPTPGQNLFEVQNNLIYDVIDQPKTGYVCNTVYLNMVRNALVSYEYLYDNNNQPILLENGQKVLVSTVVFIDGNAWYSIATDNGLYGYVKAEYIYIGDKIPTSSITPALPSPTPTPLPGGSTTMDFETKLTYEGFPESYKVSLRLLHTLYPNWVFEAYHTGLDWGSVIKAESIPGKNLLPSFKSVEWKSLETGAYSWKTDKFIVFDGTTWVTASKAAIEYYMDPRNFLNTSGIFQFELLRYQSDYQNVSGVECILKGTAMYNSQFTYKDESGATKIYTYGETFIKAAEYSGVSPYHLASRVKQEVVTGPTTLSSSVTGTYSGYEGLYNFYNIGANDSAGGGAVANGLRYARNGSSNVVSNSLYMIPWTSPYRSIVGGSYFLGGSYINRGQDTIYLQKFNVTPISTFFHQYMSNVEAPYAEGKKILSAYNGMADSPIVFSIPVYENMPTSAAKVPTTMFNPNNWLNSLTVLNMSGQELSITPTFSQSQKNYSLIVENNVEVVEIKATTVSKKATLGGGGYVSLNVGFNEIIVPVIAENGDVANYIINIVRE